MIMHRQSEGVNSRPPRSEGLAASDSWLFVNKINQMDDEFGTFSVTGQPCSTGCCRRVIYRYMWTVFQIIGRLKFKVDQG